MISEIIFSELPSQLSYFARNANSTAFLRRLMHFCLISHCPAFYRNSYYNRQHRRYDARRCEHFNGRHSKSSSSQNISCILNFRGSHLCFARTQLFSFLVISLLVCNRSNLKQAVPAPHAFLHPPTSVSIDCCTVRLLSHFPLCLLSLWPDYQL